MTVGVAIHGRGPDVEAVLMDAVPFVKETQGKMMDQLIRTGFCKTQCRILNTCRHGCTGNLVYRGYSKSIGGKNSLIRSPA